MVLYHAPLLGAVHIDVVLTDLEELDDFAIVNGALYEVRKLLLTSAGIDGSQFQVVEDRSAEQDVAGSHEWIEWLSRLLDEPVDSFVGPADQRIGPADHVEVRLRKYSANTEQLFSLKQIEHGPMTAAQNHFIRQKEEEVLRVDTATSAFHCMHQTSLFLLDDVGYPLAFIAGSERVDDALGPVAHDYYNFSNLLHSRGILETVFYEAFAMDGKHAFVLMIGEIFHAFSAAAGQNERFHEADFSRILMWLRFRTWPWFFPRLPNRRISS